MSRFISSEESSKDALSDSGHVPVDRRRSGWFAVQQCLRRRRPGIVATVVVGLAVAVAASTTSAVAKSASPASAPAGGKRGGTLNLASSWGEPTGLVPWTTNGGNQDIFWQEQVYEHLVDLLPGSKQPQPGLATSWHISKNGLTYTFQLRKGTKFS